LQRRGRTDTDKGDHQTDHCDRRASSHSSTPE
jgi:hypothetical protein